MPMAMVKGKGAEACTVMHMLVLFSFEGEGLGHPCGWQAMHVEGSQVSMHQMAGKAPLGRLTQGQWRWSLWLGRERERVERGHWLAVMRLALLPAHSCLSRSPALA